MRRRIVTLAVLASTLATCLFGVPLAIAVAHYVVADEQHELERTADVAALQVSGDLSRAREPGTFPGQESGVEISAYSATGRTVTGDSADLTEPLVRRAIAGRATSGEIGGRVAAAVPVSDGDTVVGAVLVTSPAGAAYARIARIWAGMAGLAALAVIVTALVARRLARRLTAPLDDLVITAERLGDGDFDIDTKATRIAELDLVNAALGRTAGRLDDLVGRERAFTTDASHQLRTPLTAVQVGLENALASPGADLRAAVCEALEGTRRLESTVVDLLEVARGRSDGPTVVDIGAVLDAVRERWNGMLAREDRPLHVSGEARTVTTRGSTAVVAQILDILVDNALRHGAGVVTVESRVLVGALALEVTDEGPGPDGDTRALFAGRARPDGHGIGLAMGRRLAESAGGRLVLSGRSPARFTLMLPADTSP